MAMEGKPYTPPNLTKKTEKLPLLQLTCAHCGGTPRYMINTEDDGGVSFTARCHGDTISWGAAPDAAADFHAMLDKHREGVGEAMVLWGSGADASPAAY